MRRLVGRIRPYPWGSRTAIAALQRRPVPSETPEAELWLGAHPEAPAAVREGDTDTDLLRLIEADPEKVLGATVMSAHGPQLPFLLKVLAADQPLSLQAHPDLAQAKAGYAAEEAAGVPLDAPHRRYVDTNHKPELLVALSEFDALCGFRPVAESARLVERLAVPELEPVVASLRHSDPEHALREAVTRIFATPDERRESLVAAVRQAAAGLATTRPEYRLAVELADRYPSDVGVVVALLLNLVRLAPGEAIYMPAGNLHSYLRGVGVEVMASSDNVLRGGLTSKHVDVPELLRVLRYTELPEPRLAAVEVADGVVSWPVPVPDFRLVKVTLSAGRRVTLPDSEAPHVVLCVAGEASVADSVDSVVLRSGEAAFGTAYGGPVTLTGEGELYQATVGISDRFVSFA